MPVQRRYGERRQRASQKEGGNWADAAATFSCIVCHAFGVGGWLIALLIPPSFRLPPSQFVPARGQYSSPPLFSPRAKSLCLHQFHREVCEHGDESALSCAPYALPHEWGRLLPFQRDDEQKMRWKLERSGQIVQFDRIRTGDALDASVFSPPSSACHSHG